MGRSRLEIDKAPEWKRLSGEMLFVPIEPCAIFVVIKHNVFSKSVMRDRVEPEACR